MGLFSERTLELREDKIRELGGQDMSEYKEDGILYAGGFASGSQRGRGEKGGLTQGKRRLKG